MKSFRRDSGSSEGLNNKYIQIRGSNIEKATRQSIENKVGIPTEPFKIAEMVQLPGNVGGENYWAVADFILAEYPTELALSVASAFHNMAPQLGFDPYGKILVGAQFVDRKAGSSTMMKFSFMKQHPKFSQYITERNCPNRTEKALDFLTAAMFQFPSLNHAKQVFPRAFVVPEMKSKVIKKMYSINKSIAEYITG